jgi:hypothetical protein
MEQPSPLIGYDPSTFCNCHFPGRHAARVHSTKNVVPKEGKAVSPITDRQLWRSGHVGVG